MVCSALPKRTFEPAVFDPANDHLDRSPDGAPAEGDTRLVRQTPAQALFETELLDASRTRCVARVRWTNRRADGYLHPDDGDRIISISFCLERAP